MDESIQKSNNDERLIEKTQLTNNTNESPKPLAFTIDFGDGKTMASNRYKNMVEKYQKKHKRGQSLGKLEGSSKTPSPPFLANNRKYPLSANLPRKSSFQSEGYFSSDEKSDPCNSKKTNLTNTNNIVVSKRSELSLILKNNHESKNANSPVNIMNTSDVVLKDISSPELDLLSPFSPIEQQVKHFQLPKSDFKQHSSSPEIGAINQFAFDNDEDFDKKSDSVSDAGTYTLDGDNYSEEQKARMSIDDKYKLEHVSVLKKTEDYIKSLANFNKIEQCNVVKSIEKLNIDNKLEKEKSSNLLNKFGSKRKSINNNINNNKLSPIMSPTQNISIVDDNKLIEDSAADTTLKNVFPTVKSHYSNGLEHLPDQGNVISITSSGAFRKCSNNSGAQRKFSLSKSDIHIVAYLSDKIECETIVKPRLTANIVNVQNVCGAVDNTFMGKVQHLPPSGCGKSSPTKIPSPIHSHYSSSSRPRSTSSIGSLNLDLSDSSLETESYLKPTQNFINSLQQKLMDNNSESEKESELQNLLLNNSGPQNLFKQKHMRHNSLDEKISNKFDQYHNKSIDQTNLLNQYNQNRLVQTKIQNSPNNSPIRRSSSFSTKQQQQQQRNVNLIRGDINLQNTQNLSRSASTANIKPQMQCRRSSLKSLVDHVKIDRNQFGDTTTESSSEEDFERCNQKKKNLTDLTNTRYNRAFSLRRARLDDPTPKCPNTPEMKRKFQDHNMRAISVDRKPIKTNDIQSRYLLNTTIKKPSPLLTTSAQGKLMSTSIRSSDIRKTSSPSSMASKAFSRTDSGRFSMKNNNKTMMNNLKKITKKDSGEKKTGGRSSSSLSSREVEFQNWKRRKNYDPMKAAAEGKRKELMAKRQNNMTKSYTEANNSNIDCDSSPSHSNSVHRSQSFHGTAALDQFISSEEEGDLTLSADEGGFSPPTPSPCELSPTRSCFHNSWKEHVLN